ncbi:hypothetical protein GW17_00057119 [Ensete ventricosum]|nr:hypothetical protein GW17_00057119 [Ensete ventricosum]
MQVGGPENEADPIGMTHFTRLPEKMRMIWEEMAADGGSNLFVFTLVKLKEATQSFSVSNFLREGGFGHINKGFIDEKVKPGLKSQLVTVKLLDLDGGQGHNE